MTETFAPDAYDFSLLVLGAIVLLAAWLPHALTGRPVVFPLFYVVVGALLFALPIDLLPNVHPREHPDVAEHLTELAVIVSLMGAGLKIDRRFSWRGWATTWRLLAITMPLTIVGVAALGWWAVGLAPASAVLLGAVIAPTDPVLASDVQVGGPCEGGESPVRFSLTSEAGLNDGLAFPFTNMAVAMAVVGASPRGWWAHWLGIDVFYKIAVGCVGGLAVGWLLSQLLFRTPPKARDPIARSMEGSLALAATLLAYGAVQVASGYGFIAVFVAACVVRQTKIDDEYHEALHDFTEDIEHWLAAVLLVLLGGASLDLLEHLSWPGFAVAVSIVLLVRPIAGLIGLVGRDEPWRERFVISFFGIRGIGSLYYLAYAFNEAEFEQTPELWAIVVTIILLSVLIHGLSAAPVMRHIEGRR
jgi:sodium/hydrogen antiporter